MTGRQEVSRLRSRLDATLARAPGAERDIESQADFAKYFCVLVSGFLENAIVALLLRYAQRRSSPEVGLFVERNLEWWTNPNCEKISTLLGEFSPAWYAASQAYLVDERKAAVNSLVSLRHKIAHGESVGTSLAQARAYYSTIIDVVEFFADLIEPRIPAHPAPERKIPVGGQ